MKSFLKYGLILLLFCSYGAASFEFNDQERKENYSKETHDYTLEAKEKVYSHSFFLKKIVDVQDFYPINAFAYQLLSRPDQYKSNLVNKFNSPPRQNKIYLCNSVFLIWFSFSIIIWAGILCPEPLLFIADLNQLYKWKLPSCKHRHMPALLQQPPLP